MVKRKAFTLLEVLVVIVLIGLLMTFLVPSLARIKKQAQAVGCKSNLKQWGVWTLMYTTEHDGDMWTDTGDWMGVLQPYYDDVDEIRCCPSAVKPSEDPSDEYRGSVDTMWGVEGEYWGSYGFNRWVSSPRNVSVYFWQSAHVENANQIPVFLDSTLWHALPKHTDPIPETVNGDYSAVPVNAVDCQMWRFCIDRHNWAVNGTFLDGSVREIELHKLWDQKWHRRFIAQNYSVADIKNGQGEPSGSTGNNFNNKE